MPQKTRSRRIEEQEADRCVLREEFEPYSAVFDHENGRLSTDNSYFWDVLCTDSVVSLVRPQTHQTHLGNSVAISPKEWIIWTVQSKERIAAMKQNIKTLAFMRPLARFTRISVRDLVVTVFPVLLITALGIGAAYWFMRPAPPNTLTITTGPDGSTFRINAEKYKKILARNGVKLKIVPSKGSLENLNRLLDPSFKVDVGFRPRGAGCGQAGGQAVLPRKCLS